MLHLDPIDTTLIGGKADARVHILGEIIVALNKGVVGIVEFKQGIAFRSHFRGFDDILGVGGRVERNPIRIIGAANIVGLRTIVRSNRFCGGRCVIRFQGILTAQTGDGVNFIGRFIARYLVIFILNAEVVGSCFDIA